MNGSVLPSMTKGRVLIIAGSDSGGGAGIQADIKAVTALGAYAATAVTAITVQNTLGVTGIHPIPLDIVHGQIISVLGDIGADCLKIGMLATSEIIKAAADALDTAGYDGQMVVDPVMVAKGGASLLEDQAVSAMVSVMLPRAGLITPNAPEAARLTGIRVGDLVGQRRAGTALLKLGARAALVKGGHIAGNILRDLLVWPEGERVFEAPRIDTMHTHGTGCTTASAIAAGLAQGLSLEAATERALRYVHEAIHTAPELGQGHGPLNHGWTVRKI